MLFNSIEFALFLPLVFFLFWFVLKGNRKGQNILLLIASYIFYGWWDWRFLGLIVFSSLLDYVLGIQIHKEQLARKRKMYLLLSLLVNLGFLGFFKYFNFFTESFAEAFTLFGQSFEASRLNIILPVGISFYTFQTLSYTIDIYRKQLTPTKDALSFFSFVSFFPQLVAGPIERAAHLLPQFYVPRKFKYSVATSGVKLIIWGLFKKMVIADNAAVIVDGVFADYGGQSSVSLIVGMVFFAFQIYGDFSGYSDIAIGTARLFGFDLMTNFKFPYLSKNVSDFWKRWHISLSTWFRDYLYIPLGGSKQGEVAALRNIFIVFVVSGFWHGANWTFIIWGVIHGLLYVPLFIQTKFLKKEVSKARWRVFLNTLLTFTIVCFAWVFFRADSVNDAVNYIANIFGTTATGNFFMQSKKYLLISLIAIIGILILLFTEIIFERKKHIEIQLSPRYLVMISLLILFFGAFKNQASFIYFQF
ncbi:MBOAT family protein [Gangjinia marincola]|uniref:MBOAT family protein n=1 Tax=Gangjinia marincola TaxID=578463 RepID=A0ABN1MHN8_9FLAO